MIVVIRKSADAERNVSALRHLNACGVWPSSGPNPHYPPSMLGWAVDHPGSWQFVVTDEGPITVETLARLRLLGWQTLDVMCEGGTKPLPGGGNSYTVRIEEWHRRS